MDIRKLEAMLRRLAPVVLTKALFLLILQAILWIWEDLKAVTNTAYGFSKTPAMLLEDIFWIKNETNNTAAMAILPTSPCSPSPCETPLRARVVPTNKGALRQTLSVPVPRHHQRPRFAARASGWLVYEMGVGYNYQYWIFRLHLGISQLERAKGS